MSPSVSLSQISPTPPLSPPLEGRGTNGRWPKGKAIAGRAFYEIPSIVGQTVYNCHFFCHLIHYASSQHRRLLLSGILLVLLVFLFVHYMYGFAIAKIRKIIVKGNLC
jgi:hypothetical protein